MKNLQINTDFGYSQDNYCCQENIKHLRGDTYIYIDWGNVAMPESLEDLFEILPQNNKKRKLIQFLKDGYYNPNYEDFTSFENVVCHIFDEYSIKTMKYFVRNQRLLKNPEELLEIITSDKRYEEIKNKIDEEIKKLQEQEDRKLFDELVLKNPHFLDESIRK